MKNTSRRLPIWDRKHHLLMLQQALFLGTSGLMPHPTIPDCIEAVTEGHVAYAIVPLENALEGSVPMTIDYLFHGNELVHQC